MESRLTNAIRRQFPEASEKQKREFLRFVKGGCDDELFDRVKDAFDHEVEDPFNLTSPPALWSKLDEDEKDGWESFGPKYHKIKNSTRPLQFRLGLVRALKRSARVGALPNEIDLVAPSEREKRARLRGIAEDHTEDLQAIVDHLNELPDQALPDEKTKLFSVVFGGEKDHDSRFGNWWKRAGLDYPSTVQELKSECERALKLKESFSVESTG